MNHRPYWMRASVLSLLLSPTSTFGDTPISLSYSDRDTYYVDVQVAGVEPDPYLLDTGASYMTITESTLSTLQAAGSAKHMHDLEGIMADGRSQRVSVYLVDAITIGGSCRLQAVEVAVIPGATRGLLGLSALRKASPFVLEFETATMSLGGCQAHP